MKLDEDLFQANMNTARLKGKKVLVQPSQAELTKGKKVVIREERQSMMIRPKKSEIGQWKKNERSKPRSHPKVTFDILMAKYKDGRAGVKGHKNQIIRFPWIRPVLLQQEARPAKNPGHRHDEIQGVGIIINRSIIRCLTSRLGYQCLSRGGLHR
jgi:hypothetical protein